MESQMRKYRGSMINDFLTCRKKAWWRWFRPIKLEPNKRNKNLEIGDLTHQCLHIWYENLQACVEDRLLLVEMHLNGILENALTVPEYPADELKQLEASVAEAKALMKALGRDFPTEDFTIVSAEQTVVAELVPELNIWLQATFDGIIQYKRPMLIFEHKTCGQTKGPLIRSYLRSPQIISYVWLGKKLHPEIQGGLYNFLAKLTNPVVFREPTVIGAKIVARWLESTVATAWEIEECLQKDYWKENLGKCVTLHGDCPYKPLCESYSDVTLRDYRQAAEDFTRENYTVIE